MLGVSNPVYTGLTTFRACFNLQVQHMTLNTGAPDLQTTLYSTDIDVADIAASMRTAAKLLATGELKQQQQQQQNQQQTRKEADNAPGGDSHPTHAPHSEL